LRLAPHLFEDRGKLLQLRSFLHKLRAFCGAGRDLDRASNQICALTVLLGDE